MSEYAAFDLHGAFDLHLARAFALYACISARYGVEPGGPTYEEVELIESLERERHWHP